MLEGQVLLACRNIWKIFGPGRLPGVPEVQRLAPEVRHKQGIVVAVEDASIDIHEGEIFVIMGLSGSGKSTLVRCLSRLVEPSSGEVLFRGEDLLKADERRITEIRRRHMGMVFQNFALLPHLTVLENVAFPLEIQGVEKRVRLDRAKRMVELVGLGGREQRYPRQLSGGQQQRVGIARSLAVEPDLWFLDEPFSALDPLIRREMQDEFLKLQASLKKSIVFITHDFDEALRLADRIAVMKDGRIEQVATPEDIVLSPATAYVAKFTEHVPKAKVIRAGRVMKPAGTSNWAATVHQSASLADAARHFGNSRKVIGVVDDSGRAVGQLSREDVAALMLEG
jgi:glycine betaine/proline transport system ATP-binding protein